MAFASKGILVTFVWKTQLVWETCSLSFLLLDQLHILLQALV